MQALFDVAFVDLAEGRGAAWHQRRLDRRTFRTVLDEFASLPAHGRDRQRYCRLVIQDDPPLAGSLCLILLAPAAWDASALALQMRALPAKARRKPAKGSSRSDADGGNLDAGGTDEGPPASGAARGSAAGRQTKGGKGARGVKPVRKRRLQQRLGTPKDPQSSGEG